MIQVDAPKPNGRGLFEDEPQETPRRGHGLFDDVELEPDETAEPAGTADEQYHGDQQHGAQQPPDDATKTAGHDQPVGTDGQDDPTGEQGAESELFGPPTLADIIATLAPTLAQLPEFEFDLIAKAKAEELGLDNVGILKRAVARARKAAKDAAKAAEAEVKAKAKATKAAEAAAKAKTAAEAKARKQEEVKAAKAEAKEREAEAKKQIEDAEAAALPQLPLITCAAGHISRMVRQAQAALLAAGTEVYQRHALVRPIEEEYDAADGRKTHSAALLAFTAPAMFKLLSEVAIWRKWNVRANKYVICDPPDKVVNVLLAARGEWVFPVIRGVLTCPTLRPDGSLLTAKGYDPASRYYLALPSNLTVPAIPDAPTMAEALKSLGRLQALLAKFPFVDKVSEAVALCILMTQVLRCAMACSPLQGVSANAPSTGKSFLVDLASAIALGRPCPIIPPGKNEEETEKGIRTKLLSSTPAFSVDNIYGGLNLPLLNQATERTHISIRLFGVLEEIEVENSVVIYMTGNNLTIIDEQGRRTICCRMDAGVERPEFREFDANPIDTVLKDRGRYIADILIIARAYLAYLAGGGTRPQIPPMGDSHKAWSRLVREPLVWLRCADPILSQEISRKADPVASQLSTIIDAWHVAFGMEAKTLAEASAYATTIPVFHSNYQSRDDENEINLLAYKAHKTAQEGLLAALRDGFAAGKDSINTHAWGNWMRRFEGRVSGGLKFVKAPAAVHHSVAWKLSR